MRRALECEFVDLIDSFWLGTHWEAHRRLALFGKTCGSPFATARP